MLDAAQRNAVAFFDHAVERIAGASHDGTFERAICRLDRNRFGGVVLIDKKVILQQLAACGGGAKISKPRAIFERQARIHFPAILRKKFQPDKLERAEEFAVALAGRGVIAEQHIGKVVAGVAGVIQAGAKVQVDFVRPRGLLPVAIQIEEHACFIGMRALHNRQVIRPRELPRFAFPLISKAGEVATANAAVEARVAITQVRIRVEFFEFEAQGVTVIVGLVGTGRDVYELGQVVVAEDEFVRHRRRNHVDQIP